MESSISETMRRTKQEERSIQFKIGFNKGYIADDGEQSGSCKKGKKWSITGEKNDPTTDGTIPHPRINTKMHESCKFVLVGENKVKD